MKTLATIHSIKQAEKTTQDTVMTVYRSLGQLRGVGTMDEVLAKVILLVSLHQSGKISADQPSILRQVQALNDAALDAIFERDTMLVHTDEQVVKEVIMQLSAISFDTQTLSFLLTLCLSDRRSGHAVYQDSVMRLFSALMDVKKGQSVYVSSPASLPLLPYLAQTSNVTYESMQLGVVDRIVLYLLSDQVLWRMSDLVAEPVVPKKQVDYAVSIPPFGVRFMHNGGETGIDGKGFITRSYDVAMAWQMLHLAKEQACVSIAAGHLSSTIERGFRKHLIDNGFLRAVIYMPQGAVLNSGATTALLIIDPKGGHDRVRLVELEKTDFVTKHGRDIQILDMGSLVEHIWDDAEHSGMVSVTNEHLAKDDYVLSQAKYVLSPTGKALGELLANRQTLPLNKLVNFQRGLPNVSKEGNATIYEIGANDITETVLHSVYRTREVDHQVVDDNYDNFVQPNDIVLIHKGGVGKICFIGDNAPKAGEDGWVAGLAALTLRPKKDAPISPKALYMYLQSQAGQEALSQIVVGSALGTIPLKELRQLPVIIPSKDELAQIERAFDQICDQEQVLRELTQEIWTARQQFWALI